ncbi:MAG: InlB B-repeat-containing protein, partial [Candidatus Methanomethylophilaceae archaeon]|nr:InlB B-repeat-containing protein [Candidatus Methanomethylophilaceae archaeon]
LIATYDLEIELTSCSFERTGYTFSGWSHSADGPISFSDGHEVENLATGEDGNDTIILYAKWSANTYAVNFNSNDGSSREISRTFTYDSDESLPTGLFIRVGHSFLGWSTESSGEVIRADGARVNNLSTGGTIELYALWSVNTYRIHFVDTGDSVIGDIVKQYGSDIVAPDDPVRKGYTFIGWDTEIPESMPGNDVTIAATWVANTYSVIFMSNGGTGYMLSLDIVYDTEVELTPCSFERTGYSFIGWSRSTNGVVSFSDGEKVRNLATGVTDDDAVILYAKWSANTYVVNFNSNHGENEKISRTFVYDSDESLPTGLFSRVGHTLSGWALEHSGNCIRVDGAKVDNISTGESVELYAVWSVNTYRVQFTNTGDSIIDDIVASYGSLITAPDDPVREGYTFTGWDAEVPKTMPANDLVIGAGWSVNTYRIHFTNTGDSVIHDIVMVYGSSITSPDDPVRKGYTFMDWSADVPDTMPAKNLIIEAIWVANTYFIRFMSNGGSGSMSPLTTTYDSDTELKGCSFERVGYTFMGWSLSSGGPVSFIDGHIVRNLVTGADGDDTVILYAKWSANTYTVDFNSNDGEDGVESHTFTYDSDESLPVGLFTRVGHTLLGWALEPSGELVRGDGVKADNLATDGRMDLYAVWSVNIYRIQFVDTGDSIIDDIVAPYGSSIIAPDDPVYKGHTFTGWDSKVPESVPAKDLTISATWSINSYVISFEGCELDDMVVEFGTVLDLTDPTRIGYDFTGWYEEVPISMPDHGLTFTATWSACKVHVGFHGFDELELIVDYDSEYGELPVVSRPGHDFRGWYADESLSIPIVSDVKVTNPSDHMLYGHFVKIWALSLHPDDPEHGCVEGSGVFDDGTLVSFEAVANEGFAFIRWTDGNRDPERELRLDSDLELTAVFSRVRTISLMTDTGVRMLDCPTGESVPLPTCDHSKKGFEFIGWTDGKQRYPASSQFI